MAHLKIAVDDFHLVSTYTCHTQVYTSYNEDRTEEMSQAKDTTTSTPTTATANKTFVFDLPSGSTIVSARVCVDKIGSSAYGAAVSTINGVSVGTGQSASVDVTIESGETSITIPFKFQSNAVEHDHFALGTGSWSSTWYNNVLKNDIYANHEGSLSYSGVYLLIEYKPAIEFSGWTDDPLVIGETYVKAVHMIELQQWTALLSEYANNGTPTFTEAVPGETSLALWLSQVQEIRAVLDVISPSHEAWIDVNVNCPRVDVMTQLRNIIVAAM